MRWSSVIGLDVEMDLESERLRFILKLAFEPTRQHPGVCAGGWISLAGVTDLAAFELPSAANRLLEFGVE
jgi:hypothetical protein